MACHWNHKPCIGPQLQPPVEAPALQVPSAAIPLPWEENQMHKEQQGWWSTARGRGWSWMMAATCQCEPSAIASAGPSLTLCHGAAAYFTTLTMVLVLPWHPSPRHLSFPHALLHGSGPSLMPLTMVMVLPSGMRCIRFPRRLYSTVGEATVPVHQQVCQRGCHSSCSQLRRWMPWADGKNTPGPAGRGSSCGACRGSAGGSLGIWLGAGREEAMSSETAGWVRVVQPCVCLVAAFPLTAAKGSSCIWEGEPACLD